MKKRLALLASYFVLTPIFIVSLIFYQLYLHHQQSEVSGRVLGASDSNISYNSVPNNTSNTTIQLSVSEARVDVLKEFFTRYDSPLTDYAEEIVKAADKYELDYRLLPAIAMQESLLCLKAPKGTNNCWGFGIYGNKKTSFDDLSSAIQTVSKTLAEKYHAQGLHNPEEIMSKYTPSNTGDWAENVSYVMDRLEAAL